MTTKNIVNAMFLVRKIDEKTQAPTGITVGPFRSLDEAAGYVDARRRKPEDANKHYVIYSAQPILDTRDH
jgi:hypothetical protein